MPPRLELTGQTFAKLTVIKFARRKGKDNFWLCQCDCGNEVEVSTTHLRSGGTKSCGCLRLSSDKSGKKYGRLTVISRIEKKKKGPTIWLCKCDCGNEIEVSNDSLYFKISCGCLSKEQQPDLTGQRFEKLVVLSLLDSEKENRMWLCKCDCGNETKASTGKLTSNIKKSCGCLHVERRLTAEDYNRYNNFIENTNVDLIHDLLSQRKLRSNNTTGVTGVTLSRGKYEAHIGFQGKKYNLGSFETLEEAAKARRDAELQYFGEFLDKYYDENPDKKPK